MNKQKIKIWGRSFELPVMIKEYDDNGATDVQKDACCKMGDGSILWDSSKDGVEKYILKNGLKENGIKEVDNIFKYVMPKSIYIPQTSKRTVGILCDYKFDKEHGLAIVFENEKYKKVGLEDIII